MYVGKTLTYMRYRTPPNLKINEIDVSPITAMSGWVQACGDGACTPLHTMEENGTPVRKSAVQQLQEQMKKELDDKEAELAAFKEKTKKYIEQLKKKNDEVRRHRTQTHSQPRSFSNTRACTRSHTRTCCVCALVPNCFNVCVCTRTHMPPHMFVCVCVYVYMCM